MIVGICRRRFEATVHTFFDCGFWFCVLLQLLNKIPNIMVGIIVVIALVFLALVTLAGKEVTETSHDQDQ